MPKLKTLRTKPVPTPYARYVKKLRLKAGLSITEMAKIAGMSVSYWSQMEKGLKGNPSTPAANKKISMTQLNYGTGYTRKDFFLVLEAKCSRLPKDCMDIIAFLPLTAIRYIRQC